MGSCRPFEWKASRFPDQEGGRHQFARSKVAARRAAIELKTLLLFVLNLFAQPVYIDQLSPDAPIDDRVLITPV